MDIKEAMRLCGFSEEEIAEALQDPELQEMIARDDVLDALQAAEAAALFRQIGGDAPDPEDAVLFPLEDTEDIPEDTEGMFGIFDSAEGFSGASVEAQAAAYDPQPENDADRSFIVALMDWIAASLQEIPARDVCMLGIGYEATFGNDDSVCYTVWLSYNTAQTAAANRARYGSEVWNQVNWTDDCFRTLPDAPFAAWRQAQGFDENNDGDEMITRIYDLAAAAVIELHAAQFTEQRFGRRIPVLIADLEFDPETAVRAVKVNGAACFDAQFFADCGVKPYGAG